jgi:predicted lipid-binding transport protein (Tim44 family)
MLFRSLFGGGGAMGGCGGSGIGPVEILAIAGLAWLAYRLFLGRRRDEGRGEHEGPVPFGGSSPRGPYAAPAPAEADPGAEELGTGFRHIRSMDPSFDGERFAEGTATEIFFKVQGAFAGRDVSAVAPLLSPEVAAEFASEAAELAAAGRFNRLENIAMRKTEVVEAWQEAGQDYVTVRFLANLLDYTTDEAGTLLSGSRTEPVLFEEFWTFTRPCGPNGWKLCAVAQP